MTLAAGTPQRSRKKRPVDRTRKGPLSYGILGITAVVTLVPFLYAAVNSLRTTGQISADPLGLPSPVVWSNYTDLLVGGVFWRPLLNSLVIAVLTTVLVVACGSMAAFALARLRFRGREGVYTFFTVGLLFPATVAILPLYLMLRQLDLLNSPLGVALPQAAFSLPIAVVVLRPFFQSIPMELEDAASVDGLSPFGFFWRILLPLSVPALVTVVILALVSSWNGYLLPLLVLTTPEQWTLPLGVAQFKATYLFDVAKTLSYTLLAMAPTILAYAVAERYIVRGLTAGAVKG